MTAAGLQAAAIRVDGEQMIGGLYRAAGAEPRPAAVLLHGLPGHELNLDLAHALRAAGIHVLYFHFRGCWGSTGSFSLANLIDDTVAAVAWLSQQTGVDRQRMCLIGYSLGGWACLAAFAQMPELSAAVAISPLVDPRLSPFDAALIDGLLDPLAGTDADQIEAEWNALTPIGDIAGSLAARPLLMITGDQDSIFPPDHYHDIMRQLPSANWERFPSSDHSFAKVRSGLIHRTRAWLLARLMDHPA